MTGHSLSECHKASAKKHNIVWSWLASKIRKSYITILELLGLWLHKHVSSDSFSINKVELLRDIRFEIIIVIPYALPCAQSIEHMGLLICLFSKHFYESDGVDIIYILNMTRKDNKNRKGNMARPTSH